MDHKFEEPILTVFTVLNPLEIEKKEKQVYIITQKMQPDFEVYGHFSLYVILIILICHTHFSLLML